VHCETDAIHAINLQAELHSTTPVANRITTAFCFAGGRLPSRAIAKARAKISLAMVVMSQLQGQDSTVAETPLFEQWFA